MKTVRVNRLSLAAILVVVALASSACSNPAAEKQKAAEAFAQNLSTYCVAVEQYKATYEINLGADILGAATDLFAAAKTYDNGPALPSDAPSDVADAVTSAQDLGGISAWDSLVKLASDCAAAEVAVSNYRQSLATGQP